MRLLIALLLVFSVFSLGSMKNTYAASGSNTSNTQVAASTMEQGKDAPKNTGEAPVPKNPDAPKELAKEIKNTATGVFLTVVFIVGLCALALAL